MRYLSVKTLFLVPALLLLGAGVARSTAEFPGADFVLVEKGERKLHLIRDGEPMRSFDIALGIVPIGDKEREGDFRTPEGRYMLDARNPNSEFFLSIHISYPDATDRASARARGEDPGGATQDWTNGCIAVSNSDMIDIWLMTGDNTPIEIRP